MKNLMSMNKDNTSRADLMSDETMQALFGTKGIERARGYAHLRDIAKELRCTGELTQIYKAYEKNEKDNAKQKESAPASNKTQLTLTEASPYQNLDCGVWTVDDSGIALFDKRSMALRRVSYTPILPVMRIRNYQTGEELIKIAFLRDGHWHEQTVKKEVITTNKDIVQLSRFGVDVHSDNAKLVVRYLSAVENLNADKIPVLASTSHLGWAKSEFVPYTAKITLDSNTQFRELANAVKPKGNADKWLDLLHNIRQNKNYAVQMMVSASFASVLVKVIGGLPFFVDLYGQTEGGKSITLMLAASVWANPQESKYIGDFEATSTSIEVKADFLNHLPLILDDSSKVSASSKMDFEKLVYSLCSGKGRTRSNRSLGINRESTWSNAVLTTGENALDSYVVQGGAFNRILEVPAGERMFDNPRFIVETLRKNYGMAGVRFIEIIKNLGSENIKAIYQSFYDALQSDGVMQKQVASMAIVMTADKIATEHVFKDDIQIPLEYARSIIKTRNEVSDNVRCYDYIMSIIAMNPALFPNDESITYTPKLWGKLAADGQSVAFIKGALTEICEKGGFKVKTFIPWAQKENLLITDKGRTDKNTRINGRQMRCYHLMLNARDSVTSQNLISAANKIVVDDELPI